MAIVCKCVCRCCIIYASFLSLSPLIFRCISSTVAARRAPTCSTCSTDTCTCGICCISWHRGPCILVPCSRSSALRPHSPALPPLFFSLLSPLPDQPLAISSARSPPSLSLFLFLLSMAMPLVASVAHSSLPSLLWQATAISFNRIARRKSEKREREETKKVECHVHSLRGACTVCLCVRRSTQAGKRASDSDSSPSSLFIPSLSLPAPVVHASERV